MTFIVEPFSFAVAYVDPDIAGKKVDEKYMQLFAWHWPWDGESMLPIVTSIIYTTTLSVMNAAISSLPDHSRKIGELWGCREEPNGNGGPYSRIVTLIFENNTAARWVKAVMKLSNPRVLPNVHRTQLAHPTAGGQPTIHGGCSYLAMGDISLPLA